MKPFRLVVASEILENYQYDQPFHLYFASLCKQHKNWGSKDRKIYKSLCYAYFRLGYSWNSLSLYERLVKASELLSGNILSPNSDEIFPYKKLVSDGIDFDHWAQGLKNQRPVYLVIKSGSDEKVIQFLDLHSIPFERVGSRTLKLPSESKCDELIENGMAWVMDISSQYAADLIQVNQEDMVWDACSGAGGKSLYLCNKTNFNINLTCSDRRFTILENLKSRFQKMGFPMPKIELCDLTEGFHLSEKYDRIILDVPCTGSGTWGRTPENIRGFNQDKLDYYAKIQRKLFSNVITHLKPSGTLYYMTCSVFKSENEENIQYFVENYPIQIVDNYYYASNAGESDALFVAVLQYKS